jgi:hypothetical protein
MAGWRGENMPDGGDPGGRQMTTTDVAPSKRARQSIGDMVRSLVLVGVAIGVTLVFVPGLLHPSKSQHFPPADYQDYVVGFRQLTGVPPLVPAPPPAGWRANAATLTTPKPGAHLHIGWVAPGGRYVGLEESVGSPRALIATVLGARGSTVTGRELVAGRTWQIRTSDAGEPALTRTLGGVNVILTGSGTIPEMQVLGATLQPAAHPQLSQPTAPTS